ncbi:MAG: glycosyl transferase family 2, partial [Clostridiales bacterium]|nr:glycosyl transferase family 2 [Clostridiales bacterium]
TYAAVKNGLSIKRKSGSYLVEIESWGASLYDYGAISAYRLGLYDEARNYALKACELNPTDKRLKSNLDLIEEKIKEITKKEVF